jgi:hypothetical protein
MRRLPCIQDCRYTCDRLEDIEYSCISRLIHASLIVHTTFTIAHIKIVFMLQYMLTAFSNVRSASGLIEHDDHGSTASYDDWGTIPKAHVFESEEDNVIQFVDLDEEAKLTSEKTVLRRPPGGGGQRKGREKDTQKASFISHPAFTPGSDGKCLNS